MSTILTLLLAMIPLLAQTPDNPRAWSKKGVHGSNQAGVDAMLKVCDLKPCGVTLRLELANALLEQYVPGSESPDNLEFARKAEHQFLQVLGLDANNQTALLSLAALCYQQAQSIADTVPKWSKLDESASWFEKALARNPQNKEAHYAIGVILLHKWSPDIVNARARLHMRPYDPGPLKDPALRRELRDKYSSMIEDGISRLQKALEIDPGYYDAMSYLILMIRYRADLADSPEQYVHEIELADQWTGKAIDTKKAQAQSIPSASVAPPSSGVQRISMGLDESRFNLIRKVDPEYPPLARQARIQGTVRFTVVVGIDGKLLSLRLISGHPLLVEAARRAAAQWLYKPAILNGQPVEVVTIIDIEFALENGPVTIPRAE